MDSKSIVLFSIKLGKELKDNDKPPSNVEELFVLNILEYKDRKFTSEQIANAKKGYYKLTQEDVFAIEYNLSLFWSYMHNNTGIKDMIAIREAVGKGKDEVKGEKVGYKMFFPSKVGIESISVGYSKISSPKENVGNDGQRKAKIVALFANFLGANLSFLTITSTSRTPEEQANIMVGKIFDYPMGTNYPTVRGRVKGKYIEYQQQIISEQQYKNNIYNESIKHISESSAGYRHVSKNNKYVFDIGIVESRMSGTDISNMTNSFKEFKKNSFISSNSLYYKETEDEQAYHFVID